MDSASLGNPLGWLRNQLVPGMREEPSKKEVDAARKEQVEKGQGSIFDSLAVEKEEKDASEKSKFKWVDETAIGPRNADLEVRPNHILRE